MKFLFLFLVVCVFGASCSILQTQNLVNVGDRGFLLRQKDIFRLLDRVHMPTTYTDLRDVGQNYKFYTNMDKYENNKHVKKCFYDLGRGVTNRDLKFVTTTTTTMGTLGGLPKHQPFVITNDNHRREAVCLFNFFFYAKTYDTFYRTACWAREFLNEELFTYAFTVAIKHRPDCRKFVVPAPYEIHPYTFLNNDIINKVQNVKMQGKIFNTKTSNIDGIVQNGKVITIYDNNQQVQINNEQKLTYFTDDIGLNSHYFYYHINNPFWMSKEVRKLDSTRRGEFFYYYHQQLLARFYLERLSNGLGEIPTFYWDMPIETGFMSTLRLINGMNVANRPNKFMLRTKNNFYNFLTVKDCERQIRDTVRSGFITTEDGGFVKINTPEDINTLGNFVQGNPDSVNRRVVGNCLQYAKRLLSNGWRVNKHSDRKIVPGAMDRIETTLRDPMFYQINKRFMLNFFTFKNNLPTYTHEELMLKGVEIDSVNVDKMVTFFDHFDVDVTNTVYRTEEEKVKNTDDLTFVARQTRLNHNRFTVAVNVNSDKATDVVVRMFIGPKYDSMGNIMNINQNRHNFFEIDSFLYTLKVGKQTIVRDSRDFLVTCDDPIPTRTFMHNIKDTINTDDTTTTGKFFVNSCQGHNLLPDRLLLPKGKVGGMKLKFFVIISDHITTKVGTAKTMTNAVGIGGRRLDDRAFGYPFDRRINRNTFFTTNMFMTDVTVHHVGFVNTKDTTGFVTGDTGFVTGNTGFVTGDTGFVTGNTGFVTGDTGFVTGNTGFVTGNTGFVTGNTGFVTGDNTGFYNTDNTGFFNNDNTGFVTGDNTGFYNTNTGFFNTDNTGFLGNTDKTNVDNTGFVQTNVNV